MFTGTGNAAKAFVKSVKNQMITTDYATGNCWQVIYSTFILYNIQTALHQPIEKEIRQRNRQRLHNYKPIRSVSAGLLKRFPVEFTLCPVSQFKEHIQDCHRQILQTMEPIRPGKKKDDERSCGVQKGTCMKRIIDAPGNLC